MTFLGHIVAAALGVLLFAVVGLGLHEAADWWVRRRDPK